MIPAMARFEDTVRLPRSYHIDMDEEGRLASSLDPNVPPPSNETAVGNPSDGVQANPPTAEGNEHASRLPGGPRLLSQEDTIELARRAVESGIQDTKRSLAGSEAVTDVVKPKLTVDLGHSNIVRIPEAVVDLIKDDVERLSLSNNFIFHIPYRFSECSHLRYLNVRANNFREFPKGVYKLPLLEILDLSRNKISQLPDEINQLTSLRVLSLIHNRLADLPAGLSDMTTLQILKVSGNPLRYPLRQVLEASEAEIASSSKTDIEKDVAVTAELKRFLKTRLPVTASDFESSSDTSEPSYLDTPKPVKRSMSSRFPVIPSTVDGISDARSPSISRPPPVPVKSHYRMTSGQSVYQSGPLQRPGISPIHGGNERNRSNSEGIIQASFSARSRRMGVIRKNGDLGTLDEVRPYRNSHLRGLSHNSILRTVSPTGASGSSSSSPISPKDRRRLRDGYVNRMSSLPEHKGEREVREPIIESAKGILFALYQIHFHISSLINATRRDDNRRNSLEIVFYNASTHVDRLNEAINMAENAPLEDVESKRLSNETIKSECETCLRVYIHVGSQLRNSLNKIITRCDPRYVRSLMLMIYGSMVELRNSCASLRVYSHARNQESLGASLLQVGVKESQNPVRHTNPPDTPAKDQSVPMRRFRSDTMIQHSNVPSVTSIPSASTYQSAVSSPGFPITINLNGRSRSSSRTNLINTSMPSSLATPRSGEAFPPIPNQIVPRINPLTGLDEIEEERIFEKIFHQLTSAYTAALQALPLARRQFMRCLEIAEQAREPQGIQMLWNNLIRRCRVCLEVSEALCLKLSNMKLKEPGGGIRNQREFWQLCKAFMQSFVDLVTDMREVRSMQLLPPDVIIILRPVQRASREAGRLIEASPWSFLADMSSAHPPASLYGPLLQTQHSMQHHASISTPALSTQNGSFSASSPQSVPLPATPLSAALGPAAQATVPSTPASAYSDKFFEGDVFQRADSLLSAHQPPFFSRR